MTTEIQQLPNPWYCKNHEVINICKCGMNYVCFACGMGAGVQPCDCTPLPNSEILTGTKSVYLGEEVIA